MDKKTQIIVLAAGYGSRISDVTALPKCLLEINGKSLLERQLEIWKELSIKDVHLVLGYKKEEIERRVEKYKDFFNFTFSVNEDFRTKGNTFSLLLGLQNTLAINLDLDQLIFTDADIIYDPRIFSNFLNDINSVNQILVGKGDINDQECAKVLIDSKGMVFKTIDKRSITKEELTHHQFAGEAIGILKFNIKDGSANSLLDSCQQFLSLEGNILKNWEHLINFHLEKKPNFPLHISYLDDELPWIEIDNQEDYNAAKDLFRL